MARPLTASVAQVTAFRARAQFLDERLGRPRWTECATVGLQDTPPGSGALAVAARVDGVTASTWDDERVLSRNLVVSWSLRGAPFGHLPADHDLFSVAALPADDASWLALLSWTRQQAAQIGRSPGEAVTFVAESVRALLADGPMTKTEVSTALREGRRVGGRTIGRLPDELLPFCKPCGVHHVSEQVLRNSALFGGLVFGQDRDGRFTLVRTEDWSNAARIPTRRSAASASSRRRELVRRFLGAYGPADPAMFASWLGVAVADGAARFTEVTDDDADALVPVTLEGATKWLHSEDVAAFRSAARARIRGVRLLPFGDPFLQSRDREVLVPDPVARKTVWRPIGSPGVLLVDGAPTGTWRAQKKGPKLTLTVEPWAPLSPGDRNRLDEEAALVAAVRGVTDVVVTATEV